MRGVQIPASIVWMMEDAFENSEGLESASYLGTASEWCSIKFDNEYSNPMCYANDFYTIDGLLVNAVLDEGLEKISSYAFYNSKTLTSIYIPNSVSEIGARAFCKCKSLDNIVFNGTVNEWRNVTKGKGWIDGASAVNVTCLDGEFSVQK